MVFWGFEAGHKLPRLLQDFPSCTQPHAADERIVMAMEQGEEGEEFRADLFTHMAVARACSRLLVRPASPGWR